MSVRYYSSCQGTSAGYLVRTGERFITPSVPSSAVSQSDPTVCQLETSVSQIRYIFMVIILSR